MSGSHSGGDRDLLRNLSAVMREQEQRQDGERPKPAVTDHHILKAMLGKRWGTAEQTDDSAPARKAG